MKVQEIQSFFFSGISIRDTFLKVDQLEQIYPPLYQKMKMY